MGEVAAGELTLADQAEIRDLGLKYADAWLSRDAEKMISLWSGRPEEISEPDAVNIDLMRELTSSWDRLGTTILHVTNHLVWKDTEDRARGRVYCLAQMDRPEGFVEQTIIYQDRYVRDGGRWLFDWRRHLLWFGQAREANPLDQAPAEWVPQGGSQVGAGHLPADLAGLGVIEPNPVLR